MSIFISESFTGGLSADVESIDGEGKLRVKICDSIGQEQPVTYVWEELDSDANGMNLSADGQVSSPTRITIIRSPYA